MTRRSWMFLLLALMSASVLGISISTKRMINASARVASAQQACAATIRDAREVLDLRSKQQTIQLRQRPAQDVIAQVNAVLADAGIPANRFKSLTPESESSVSTGQDTGIKQQSLRLTLENLSLAEIGGFLNQWRTGGGAASDTAIWTPTRMELTHVRSSGSASSAPPSAPTTTYRWCSPRSTWQIPHDPSRPPAPTPHFSRLLLGLAAIGRMGLITAMLTIASSFQAGCAGEMRTNGGGGSPYATPSSDSRDSLKAQRLTSEAAEIIDSDPAKAESLLREALTADVWFGPSHNDLGVVYLKQGKLYEAANEFEWARKLMPGHPDPRMNLALTLERAGRVDEAIATYGTALEVYPNHLPTMQALSRLQLRRGKTDERTTGMLKEIALSGDTPQWRTWAQKELVRSSAAIR